jgi:hypothetical protein
MQAEHEASVACVSLRVRNSRATSLTFYLEPWGEAYRHHLPLRLAKLLQPSQASSGKAPWRLSKRYRPRIAGGKNAQQVVVARARILTATPVDSSPIYGLQKYCLSSSEHSSVF